MAMTVTVTAARRTEASGGSTGLWTPTNTTTTLPKQRKKKENGMERGCISGRERGKDLLENA